MTRLRSEDFQALNESILVLNGDSHPASLPARLKAAVSVLMPADVTALECFDSKFRWTGRIFADPEQEVTAHFDIFLQEQLNHPLFPLFVEGKLVSPVRLSDVLSLRELRARAIYSRFLKPLGIDRQLAISLRVDAGRAGVLTIGRKAKDFSRSEVACLQAFVRHVELATRVADRALARDRDAGVPLPQKACSSLETSLNITESEARILQWLACGKADSEIAEICHITRRTVQKHCENIYCKLGVENRTGAVVRALEYWDR